MELSPIIPVAAYTLLCRMVGRDVENWPIVTSHGESEEEVAIPQVAKAHDHKGFSEEKCIRCGWVMGNRPLNCNNDSTPHIFPSQLHPAVAEVIAGLQPYRTQVLASLDGGETCPTPIAALDPS